MGSVKYRDVSDAFAAMAAPGGDKGRSSLGMEAAVGEFFYIKLEKLIPFKNQARETFDVDEVNSLAESIKNYGVRQPITVVKSLSEDGKFEIVSGERRVRAARIAGLEKIPSIILDDYKKAETIAVIENLHRVDLHPVELARAYKSLLDNGAFDSAEGLFSALGVNRSVGYETLKILELPMSKQQFLLQNNIRNREEIRELFKKEGISEKGKKIPNDSVKQRSVMRISSKNGELFIQKKRIASLTDAEKAKLKAILEDLLSVL